MNKLGIIGYGSIGSMIANGFLNLEVLEPAQLFIYEPMKEKAKAFRKKWPEVTFCNSNTELAQACDTVYVCVKPHDAIPVYKQIKDHLKFDTHIISVAAGLTIQSIEKVYKGRISRVIPSFTSEIYEGVSLVCHNKEVSYGQVASLERMLNEISTVKRIKEADFEAATDLTSCGPGWIAYIFDEFVNTGIKHSSLSKEEAEEMVISTLYGTAKLLYDKKIGFKNVMDRVATKGGITEEGIMVMKEVLPQLFDDVFIKTLKKIKKTKSETGKKAE